MRTKEPTIREKSFDQDNAERMVNPLPGAMMPMDSQEALVPAKKKMTPANDAKSKSHYSDEGDKDQTVPL